MLCIGAVQTISKLMRKEETRAAAMTMLGATTAVCSEQVALNLYFPDDFLSKTYSPFVL